MVQRYYTMATYTSYDLAFLFYRAAEMKGRGYGVIDVPTQVEKLHIMHPREVQWKRGPVVRLH